MKFTGNENIYVEKLGWFNESNFSIEKIIMSPAYTIQPKEGDIYLRYNKSKNGIFSFIFSGKSNKHYDVAFGAGMEYHSGKMINFKELEDLLFKDKVNGNVLLNRINKKFKSVEGFKIWE